jgi:aminoacyl-tRNA hydrolase
MVKRIFLTRPWQKFHVQEIAAAIGGSKIPLEGPLRIVRPQIGVVTNIGADHINAFHTVEAIAAEKSKLIAALPGYGVAILNADDPNVLAMQAGCAARVMTYGVARTAMVRAERVRSQWPERLSFTVLYDGQAYPVNTQLCGKHWVSCVLAAIAVGIAMGVPLATVVQAIQATPPFSERMCPVNQAGEITFIRDDAKAPLWSIAPALEFMKEAHASRKIVVVGTISDYQGNSDRQYVSVARQALDVADRVVFVGPRASKCLKAKRHPDDDSLRAFYSVDAAREYLREVVRAGDVVLLKGTRGDHLSRLIAGPTQEERRRMEHREQASAGGLPGPDSPMIKRSAQAVLGLGNPGEKYRDTPHNVGHRVLDLLLRFFGSQWVQQGKALVARIQCGDTTLFLIKPLTYVNSTGPVLAELSHELGFEAAECVLVLDDIDLPLGTVRVRRGGSDGGHKGVRSIFEACRTDALRRVKIGVRPPEQKPDERGYGQDRATYLLQPFAPMNLPVIERASAEAAEQALRLLRIPVNSLPLDRA